MNIGRMDRRIVIKQLTTTKDTWNHDIVSYTTRATVWATVKEKTGTEVQDNDQRVAKSKTEFTIRHRSDLEYTDTITFGGDVYDIHSFVEIGRAEGLTIVAEKRDNDA